MGPGPSHEMDLSSGRGRERRPGSRNRLGEDGLGSSGSGAIIMSPCTPKSSIMESTTAKTVFPYANSVDEVKAWFKKHLEYNTSDDSD